MEFPDGLYKWCVSHSQLHCLPPTPHSPYPPHQKRLSIAQLQREVKRSRVQRHILQVTKCDKFPLLLDIDHLFQLTFSCRLKRSEADHHLFWQTFSQEAPCAVGHRSFVLQNLFSAVERNFSFHSNHSTMIVASFNEFLWLGGTMAIQVAAK